MKQAFADSLVRTGLNILFGAFLLPVLGIIVNWKLIVLCVAFEIFGLTVVRKVLNDYI